jgi:Ser/Thr protein kinase RdoA (MazF antagonist)
VSDSEQDSSVRSLHPFDRLTPDFLLDALQNVGVRGDGRLLALNSYENRVWQVGVEDGETRIAKFYRPARWTEAQLREEHAFAQALVEDDVPVVAPLALRSSGVEDDPESVSTLHHYQDFYFAVFPRRGGRAPELDRAGVLERMGYFLGRLHTTGALHRFTHRPTLSIEEFGREPLHFLLAGEFIPFELKPSWQAIAEQALQAVEECFTRVGEVVQIRIHGDCHPGNVLWTQAGPHFVDFDDARNGPAIQDIWMLLSGSREEQQIQLEEIMRGYRAFRRFDARELGLVEALRTLRLLHYSAWIARRWDDPAFPMNFPWFGTTRYWQDRILELREQVAAMQEPALYLQD